MTIYPFSAITGQDQMKLALILNAIDPRIGGVLVATAIRRDTFKVDKTETLVNNQAKSMTITNLIYWLSRLMAVASELMQIRLCP